MSKTKFVGGRIWIYLNHLFNEYAALNWDHGFQFKMEFTYETIHYLRVTLDFVCRAIGINLMGRINHIFTEIPVLAIFITLSSRNEKKKYAARKLNLNIVVTLNVIKLVNNEKHS